jgi:branched-chain amino acid transport system ATP-binding protein
MLEVRNLTAGYGPLQVLWDVSLRVDEGEIVTLLGANGAGKSTTIRAIAGALRPIGGGVEFEGREIHNQRAHEIVEQGLVQIPEGRQIWGELSVEDNIDLGAFSHHARPHRQRSKEWVYSLFPVMAERRKSLGRNLSGGQQQMLAIARALMSKPRLLMLDEPSLGLAPQIVAEVFEILIKIIEEDITVLLVEQNVEFALQIADRAYVMEGGRITREGLSEELLQSDDIRASYLGL